MEPQNLASCSSALAVTSGAAPSRPERLQNLFAHTSLICVSKSGTGQENWNRAMENGAHNELMKSNMQCSFAC